MNIRPYAKQLIETLAKNFEIIVYTTTPKYQADPVLNIIDPTEIFINHRLFREDCPKTLDGWP